jgi:hypothetical protein
MADAETHGVKINLISSRKLDTMTSEEKLRFILDEVKRGSVLVLERGLTAEEEIDLIKATMSEINHNTFIGIEMQSYSSNDLETSSWLSRILGRTRVPKMSVIGPASLLKTIHKDGSMIQTMVLTGESISRETQDEPMQESGESIQEPEVEFGSEPETDTEPTTPYDSPDEGEGDIEAESSETSFAPDQILTPPEPPEDVPNEEPIEPPQETNYPPPENNFEPEPAVDSETTAPEYYGDSTPTDQDYSVPVEPAPEETPPQEPVEATPLSLDDLETARGTMEYAEPYNPPAENLEQPPEELPDDTIESTEPNESQEPAQQGTTEYPSESPGETAEQEQPNENPENSSDQETISESEPPEDPQQESVGFLYRRLKTEEE